MVYQIVIFMDGCSFILDGLIEEGDKNRGIFYRIFAWNCSMCDCNNSSRKRL